MSSSRTASLDGRLAAIATKHAKEQLFSPPLGEQLGLTVVVAHVDTDLLGTFSGETPRVGSALDTAREKAELAIQHSDADIGIGIGSEGSFGPHPGIPFIPVDVELAVLIDTELGLEIVEGLTTTDTNYNEVTLDTPEVPQEFLSRVGFPDHALVVLPTSGHQPLFKGIQDVGSLHDAVEDCFDASGGARVQTDMRAHLNPTRRRAIAALAAQLADRLAQHCPRCTAPGWGVAARTPGLACSECGSPTGLIASVTMACARTACDYQQRIPNDDTASPANCPYCNP